MTQSSLIEGTNVVTVTYRGAVGADDIDALRGNLDQAAARGPVRLLLEFHDVDLGRVEPEALWKDVKAAGRLGDVDRCAVVTDEKLMETFAAAATRVAPFEVKRFAGDQRDEAVAWLTATG